MYEAAAAGSFGTPRTTPVEMSSESPAGRAGSTAQAETRPCTDGSILTSWPTVYSMFFSGYDSDSGLINFTEKVNSRVVLPVSFSAVTLYVALADGPSAQPLTSPVSESSASPAGSSGSTVNLDTWPVTVGRTETCLSTGSADMGNSLASVGYASPDGGARTTVKVSVVRPSPSEFRAVTVHVDSGRTWSSKEPEMVPRLGCSFSPGGSGGSTSQLSTRPVTSGTRLIAWLVKYLASASWYAKPLGGRRRTAKDSSATASPAALETPTL
mmetsp:Transcript_18103/g.48554  ORF Transcript_18103/g.48554 Transcript_18103/m.48554 type:complete len:269 (-) Transcript_18103:1183-1989(-)